MDALSVVLVCSAALVHATWNLLAKKAAGGALFIWWYSVATAVLYLPVVLWIAATGGIALGAAVAGAIAASGLLHLGYSVSLQTGYRRADLSVVYPVARGTGPLLSVAGAILILGEPLTGAVMAGGALVVTGVLVVGTGGKVGGEALWRGIRWGAFTGAFIASYTLLDGAAVKLLALSPIVLDYFGNLVRLAALTPGALRDRAGLQAEWRRNARLILGCGALVPVSYVLILFAVQRAPISVIAPARELSMMVGVLFGWWLLKEQDVARRLAGAVLIAAGVAVLMLG
jgi:uncharacterized membrane protein